jgi:carboxyl-terminal processing protease
MKKENKNNEKIRKIIFGGLFVLVFISGWILGHQDAKISKVGYTPSLLGKDTGSSSADFSTFWRAWDLIEKNYDGTLDYSKMVNGAIEGMVRAVGDPYTAYMSPEDSKRLEDDLSGVVSGIGAEVGIRDNKLVIIAPIDDSPAKKAGLLAGDHISQIDGKETANIDVNEAVSRIRGKEGTKVKLNIIRNGAPKEYEITRAKITVKSVKSEIKSNNIGYISVSRFDSNTTAELRSALNDVLSKGSKKIVLDLRDNPGGYLDESVTVASEFIKSGIIVTEKKDKLLGRKNEYKATGKGIATSDDIKLAVLVNNGSASASEIVAGAIKDLKRGILVGEKTFGKGSVQEIESLAKGSKLRITIAHWYTPNGRNIGKEGILPDVEVKMTEADYNAGKDPQLDKAMELLNR